MQQDTCPVTTGSASSVFTCPCPAEDVDEPLPRWGGHGPRQQQHNPHLTHHGSGRNGAVAGRLSGSASVASPPTILAAAREPAVSLVGLVGTDQSEVSAADLEVGFSQDKAPREEDVEADAGWGVRKWHSVKGEFAAGGRA